jgi:hypothetical protein
MCFFSISLRKSTLDSPLGVGGAHGGLVRLATTHSTSSDGIFGGSQVSFEKVHSYPLDQYARSASSQFRMLQQMVKDLSNDDL